MTDRVDTNQDLETTLAVIQEQITSAADPTLLAEGARNRLGEMYTAAEAANDGAAMQSIQKAWDDVQALVVDTTRAREFALTAMDINKTFQNQRDNALKELEDLTDAVESADFDNPHIEAIYDMGFESGSELGFEDGIEHAEMINAENAEESFFERLSGRLQNVFGYTDEPYKRIAHFIDIMGGDIHLTDEQKQGFFDWIDGLNYDEDGDDDDE